MHTTHSNTQYKNESNHSEMGPVRQNPIQRTVSLFICVCIALCTIGAHNIAQNRPDSFPPYPPDNHHCSDDVYYSTISKFVWAGFLIFVLVFVSRDLELGGVPAVSPSRKNVSRISVTFGMYIQVDE